jgi:hypothetical protein
MCRILKNKFTAGWAGILQCRPGDNMLRPDYSLLGRHMKSPGRNIARSGRINTLSRLGQSLSIRLGRHPLPGGPRRPALLPALAWASLSSCPGVGQSLHSPAGPGLSPPAGPAPSLGWRPFPPRLGHRAPAGPPSLSSLAGPGLAPRLGRFPPTSWQASSSATPGWAGSGGSGLAGIPSPGRNLQCPGWARPGFPAGILFTRPD